MGRKCWAPGPPPGWDVLEGGLADFPGPEGVHLEEHLLQPASSFIHSSIYGLTLMCTSCQATCILTVPSEGPPFSICR